MGAMDKLLIACIIFFVIDLTFVGTTVAMVCLLVVRILTGKVKDKRITALVKKLEKLAKK